MAGGTPWILGVTEEMNPRRQRYQRVVIVAVDKKLPQRTKQEKMGRKGIALVLQISTIAGSMPEEVNHSLTRFPRDSGSSGWGKLVKGWLVSATKSPSPCSVTPNQVPKASKSRSPMDKGQAFPDINGRTWSGIVFIPIGHKTKGYSP